MGGAVRLGRSFFYRQPRLHPSLLSFWIMRHVGVAHRRQFTGGVLTGVSMSVCAVGDDLDIFIGQQLRSEVFDLLRGNVQRSGNMGFALAFWRKRLNDFD